MEIEKNRKYLQGGQAHVRLVVFSVGEPFRSAASRSGRHWRSTGRALDGYLLEDGQDTEAPLGFTLLP